MKKYRLFEITTVYDKYLMEFNERNSDWEKLSYDELYTRFVNDNFAESDYIHRYFKQMNLNTKIVFYNYVELQNKWIDGEKKSPFDILLGQIKEFEPDVILVMGISIFSREQLLRIKSLFPQKSIKFIAFHFFHISNKDEAILDLYDLVLTGSRSFLEVFQRYGVNAKLLRHAFEPSIYYTNKVDNRNNSAVFPGNVYLQNGIHKNRLDMLCALIDSDVQYNYYGKISGIAFGNNIQKLRDMFFHPRQQLMVYKILKDKNNYHPSIFGNDYYRVLGENLVCVNCHIPAIGNGAGNMRMFESTGMGACLLTDAKAENAELFEVDKEIVTFSTVKEFKDKLRWLINNPDIAKEIADAGQKKTFAIYSYERKAELLDLYIQELFK